MSEHDKIQAYASSPAVPGADFTDATEEDWVRFGEQLSHLEQVSTWVKADWWAAGEDAGYGTRGETAARFGWSPKTLSTYASTARAVPLERRNPSLSFGHHAAIASKPAEEQKALLQGAEESGASVRELEREARGLPEASAPKDAAKSSSAAAGATNEEAALGGLQRAAEVLEDVTALVDSAGFRLTVPVAQRIIQSIESIIGSCDILLQRAEDEAGSVIDVPSVRVG